MAGEGLKERASSEARGVVAECSAGAASAETSGLALASLVGYHPPRNGAYRRRTIPILVHSLYSAQFGAPFLDPLASALRA